MKITQIIKRAWNNLIGSSDDLSDEEMLEWLGIDTNLKKQEINEITYFTCLKMLSETMGKLPLKFYQQTNQGKIRAEPNAAARLLMNRPNNIMTPATFWGTVEYNCEHYGNAYVWIQTVFEKKGRYGGEYRILGFWIMQSNYVQVLYDNAGIFGNNNGGLYYRYSDPLTGKQYTFSQENVLHFKTWCTINGVLGKPVRQILKDSLSGAIESQNYLNKLYESGLTASAVLQYTGDLDKGKRLALQKEYNSLLSEERKESGRRSGWNDIAAIKYHFGRRPIRRIKEIFRIADSCSFWN